MKKRIAYLSSILSLTFRSQPQTAAEHETLISDWLNETAADQGISRHTLRRDLIFSNGYRGEGSTTAFASDVRNAIAGNPDDLLTQIKARKDEPALRDLLASFVAPKPPTSAEWIEQQVREHNLDGRLSSILKKKSRDDYAEVRSFVGLWLATWGHEGTFDEVLAQEGTVRIGVLVRFLQGKLRNEYYQRGREPLCRMFGARTEHEVRVRRETDDNDYISKGAEKISGSAPEVSYTYDDDEVTGFEVVTPERDIETDLIQRDEAKRKTTTFRAKLRKNHPKAHERYLRIFDRMVEGQRRDDIAAAEGISTKRAGTLTCEIRAELRQGLSREHAAEILSVIERTPHSTREDIEKTMTLNTRAITQCLRYLLDKNLISESEEEEEAYITANLHQS